MKKQVVRWIKEYFEENGKNAKAIVGISGGKDSSVVAALCVEALGKERVFGVLMPNGEQFDVSYSFEICKLLGIPYAVINIAEAVKGVYSSLQGLSEELNEELNSVVTFNTPARIRMTTLYAVSGMLGGRVANTCNLSEDWVGYATKFGDGAGDFSPLSNLTVKEVIELGRELGLPEKFLTKTPIDGLCGKTDEENLGFTYEVLDDYILTGKIDCLKTKEKIDTMNKNNAHKMLPMPAFEPFEASGYCTFTTPMVVTPEAHKQLIKDLEEYEEKERIERVKNR